MQGIAVSWRAAAMLLAAILLAALPACSESDDDDNHHTDAPADDDGAGGVELEGPLRLTVHVEEAPEGNPLARRLAIVTDRPCSLTGYVTTADEIGYGPSTPAATERGTQHFLWFFGLLPDQVFDYHIYEAGNPDEILATGWFETKKLPWWTPTPDEVFVGAEAGPETWFAMSVNLVHDISGNRPYLRYIGLVQVIDRQGRVRMFHRIDESNYDHFEPYLEGLQVLRDGQIAFNNRRDIRVTDWSGAEGMLFDVQLNPPYISPTHHQPYIFDQEPRSALVLFNTMGSGIDCFGRQFDRVVADSIGLLDESGRELRRWSLFDHQDQVPPDDFGPCGCAANFWEDATIDFSHANSVYPVPNERALILSLRNLSRILKIDVDTGDILWALGPDQDFDWLGPEMPRDRWFDSQHDVHPLPNGHLLFFDNGSCRQGYTILGAYSRALELAVDEENMTVSIAWEHRTDYAGAMGNIARLANGNTFIAGGWGGYLIEVKPDQTEIWKLQYPTILQMPNIARVQPLPALWRYEERD
jgi:hypothetical protein